jgi:hypothetical protein
MEHFFLRESAGVAPTPIFYIYGKNFIYSLQGQRSKRKGVEDYKSLLSQTLIFSHNCGSALRVTACNSLTKNLLHCEKEKFRCLGEILC